MAIQDGAAGGIDAAIISRMVHPDEADLTEDAAEAVLRIFRLDQDVQHRLHDLLVKNPGRRLDPRRGGRTGELSPDQPPDRSGSRQGPVLLEEARLGDECRAGTAGPRAGGKSVRILRVAPDRLACDLRDRPHHRPPASWTHGRGQSRVILRLLQRPQGAEPDRADPATEKVTRLPSSATAQVVLPFPLPREHELLGRTAIGRTTIDVLRMNHPSLVALREILMAAGLESIPNVKSWVSIHSSAETRPGC